MLKQGLQQKLLQKLSPQQIQFIKLLQLPTTMLDARIKEEMEENPALEDETLLNHNDETEEYSFDEEQPNAESEDPKDDLDFDIEDYIQQDEKEYAYGYDYNPDDDDDKKEKPVSVQIGFYEQMMQQLHMQIMLSEHDFMIAEQIIGSIDDAGYLSRDIPSLMNDLAFTRGIDCNKEDIEHLIELIQQFDPPGICARDLKECLMLQLQRKDNSLSIKIAKEILRDYFDAFTKKHYDKIEKGLEIDHETLRDAIHEITKLNPKPGNSGSSEAQTQHIIPDFILSKDGNSLKLQLNGRNAPELKVSRQYKEMLDHYSKASDNSKQMKEAVHFVKHKLDSAKWFIDAIRQRQHTLLKTMNAIIDFQYEYFLEGDETKLKPMILKDIGDVVEMDISTVSRVASSKYIQTEFGTFLLKSFFSEGIQTKSGEEVSNIEVKKILEEVIGKENKDKPVTDDELSKILKQKGYNIARRTVAKYREQLNIPVARLRKEI